MIGTRMKDLRIKKGITRADFANAIGSTERALISYEQQTRGVPIDLLPTIASCLNVSTDYLLGLTDNPVPPPKSMREILDEDPLTAGVETLAAHQTNVDAFTESQKRELARLIKDALEKHERERKRQN